LQQSERPTASAEKNEFGSNMPVVTALFVPDLHAPKTSITAQILHTTEIVN
jgi:hypothetical protein